MIETDCACNLPFPILLSPEDDELRFSDVAGFAGMVEAVNSDFDGSEVGDGVNLQGSGNEFPGDLAADVVLYGVNERLPSDGEASLVVVELQVPGHQRAESRQVAVIVGVEELRIERLDGPEELIGWGRSLRLGSGEWRSEQDCESQ